MRRSGFHTIFNHVNLNREMEVSTNKDFDVVRFGYIVCLKIMNHYDKFAHDIQSTLDPVSFA